MGRSPRGSRWPEVAELLAAEVPGGPPGLGSSSLEWRVLPRSPRGVSGVAPCSVAVGGMVVGGGWWDGGRWRLVGWWSVAVGGMVVGGFQRSTIKWCFVCGLCRLLWGPFRLGSCGGPKGKKGARGGAEAQRVFWRVGMLGVWAWGLGATLGWDPLCVACLVVFVSLFGGLSSDFRSLAAVPHSSPSGKSVR